MVHIRSQETVDSALRMSDEGVPDKVNAEIHGVAIKTIRRWRRLYQRRGLPRGTGFQGTPCPRCDGAELDEAAYALLLGWYLGDGSIAKARRGVFTLQIANDESTRRSTARSSRPSSGSSRLLALVPGTASV